RGTLMAPSADPMAADPRWSRAAYPQQPTAGQRIAPPRLPPGYRWIAVRPGSAPPRRRRRGPLGPTPRYAVMPRWGLGDRVDTAGVVRAEPQRSGPTVAAVQTTLSMTMAVLGIAALAYLVRYV